jgi:hypothetical protein
MPNPLNALQAMRDADLNSLHDLFQSEGTAAQRAFLDNYATSQSDTRKISQDLLSGLSSITDNSPASQVKAAIILIQMKVSPIISIHIPFGGDNHQDADLGNETLATNAALVTINNMFSQLSAANLQDQVTFANMNVFGRTLSYHNRQRTGRDHLANHHCTIIVGKAIRGGVIGGVVANGNSDGSNDYTATNINSVSGAGGSGGDIQVTDTLASVGQTLAVAVGTDPAFIADRFTSGTVIQAALTP